MEDKAVSISITFGTVVKTLLVLILAWFLYTLRSIALDVFTAIVIASAIEPAVATLQKYKIPRAISILSIYLTLILVFFSIFFFFLPSLLGDMSSLLTSLPNYINAFTQSSGLASFAHLFGIPLPRHLTSLDITTSVGSFLNVGLFDNAFSAAGNIFGGVLSFVLIFVFSVYFAFLETGVDDFLSIVTPRSYESYVVGLWRRSQKKIGLWMQGQLLLAFIMGVLVFLGLTFLGVPNAIVLGFIAAAFEVVPVFGPLLAALPAVAIAFLAGGTPLGLLTLGMYLIAQQLENHIIAPMVVNKVVGVPPLLVILAVIVGGELAGFLGIILAVPAAATIQEFVSDLQNDRIPGSKKTKEVEK